MAKKLENMKKAELMELINNMEGEAITLRREVERLTIENESLANALVRLREAAKIYVAALNETYNTTVKTAIAAATTATVAVEKTSAEKITDVKDVKKVEKMEKKIEKNIEKEVKKDTQKNAPQPEETCAEKHKKTREEALTEKYGPLEVRKKYIEDKKAIDKLKADIRQRAAVETSAEAKATGKWMRKSEWRKNYNAKVEMYMKEVGLE